MKLFGWFSKPEWEHRDAERRAHAVAHSKAPELIALLPNLLRQDPSPAVRLAVLRRIHDTSLLADRAHNESDAGVRTLALTRLVHEMNAAGHREDKLRTLKLIEAQDTLEAIARAALDPDVRHAALARCQRQGFLAERCLEEAHAATRLQLVERIEARGTLERLAEQARTRDKRLYKALRARIDGERADAGEASVLAEQARQLCNDLEALLGRVEPEVAARLSALRQQWTALQGKLDGSLDKRVAGLIDSVQRGLDAAEAPPTPAPSPVAEAAPVAAVAAVLETPESQPAPPPEPERVDADLGLTAFLRDFEARAAHLDAGQLETWRDRWQKAWARIAKPNAADRELAQQFSDAVAQVRARAAEQEAARGLAEQKAREALEALERALDEGHVAQARAAEAAARAALEHPALARHALGKRLEREQPRLRKLADWQRWSDNKLRARWCEELEQLPHSGLHPDALATRVQELKTQWQALKDSEREPGAAEPAESGYDRRFRFLCHKALEPARPYFEKRREVRAKRTEALAEFLASAATALADPAQPNKALIALKREAGERLHHLDEVDPKQRGESTRALKRVMEQVSARLDQSFQQVEQDKRKLLANLRRQLADATLDEALDLAKSAQRRWQSLGQGARGTDQALWKELRDLVDPWFAQRENAVAESKAAEAQAQAAAVAVVEALDAAVADASLSAEALQHRIHEQNDAWRNLAEKPRGLEARFDRAVERAEQSVAQRAQAARLAALDELDGLAALCAEIEQAAGSSSDPASTVAAWRQRWQGLAQHAHPALQQRFEAALAAFEQGAAPTSEVLAQRSAEAHRLMLEIEHLAGTETPSEFQAERMNLKVARLAARLSDGRQEAPWAEAERLIRSWSALGPLAANERSGLDARYAKAKPALAALLR